MRRIGCFVAVLCLASLSAGSASAMSTLVGAISLSPGSPASTGSILLPQAANVNGSLAIAALGDFDNLNEESEVFLDMVSIGKLGRFHGGSFAGFPGFGLLTQTFIVQGSVLSNVLSDGQVTISFTPNANVGGFPIYTGVLSYSAVPEPSTWALVAIGTLAIGGIQYRRKV